MLHQQTFYSFRTEWSFLFIFCNEFLFLKQFQRFYESHIYQVQRQRSLKKQLRKCARKKKYIHTHTHTYNTLHKFWDQSPFPHYQCCLQVSYKYQRQCLGTSFRVATRPICCNIEQGEGVWFISAKWTIPEFP